MRDRSSPLEAHHRLGVLRGPRFWLAFLVSLAGHAALVCALLMTRLDLRAADPAPITVALVTPPVPSPPPPAPPKISTSAPLADPPAPRARPILRPTPKPPPDVEPLSASRLIASEPSVLLGEGDLVGATTAGAGAGSGLGSSAGDARCDMVRLLEAALRKNPRVQAALARAHPDAAGRAVLVWNGDWIQNAAQTGKGLAGIREAIILEVGFAPAACRADPMRGLVVIALDDGAGGARLALGARAWRWSDLLYAR